MNRKSDLDNAVFDLVSQHLYDPVEYLSASELVADDYEEYADDDSFIEDVYNQAGAVFKKFFGDYTGS